MRTALAILLLLAAPVIAEKTAADLFYRAFWLEHGQGDADQALALYGRVLAEFPDAPEAPRAVLGTLRLRLARGEEGSELLRLLEERYPESTDEIAQARRLLAPPATTFDSTLRASDSPVEMKLKELFDRLWEGKDLDEHEKAFLIDAGPVSQPMLRGLLYQPESSAAKAGAELLWRQQRPDAHAILEQALRDDALMLKSAVVVQLGWLPVTEPAILQALAVMCDRASPRLQVDVVTAVARLAGVEGEGRAIAYDLLARALESPDPDVRKAASAPRIGSVLDIDNMPDGYVDALLARLASEDPALDAGRIYPYLPRYAKRVRLVDRLFALLAAREPAMDLLKYGLDESGARLLARVVLHHREKGISREPHNTFITNITAVSSHAAVELGRHAFDTDDVALAAQVALGLQGKERTPAAATLRDLALAALLQGREDIAAHVLTRLRFAPDDFDPLMARLRGQPDARLPRWVLPLGLLPEIGPECAARLVPFCGQEALDELLRIGLEFDDDAFFAAVVPRAGPDAARWLDRVAGRRASLADMVARRLLAATEPGWGWGNSSPDPGPRLLSDRTVWQAFDREPLRSEIVAHVTDPRPQIADRATRVVRELPVSEETTKAVVAALASPLRDLRRWAALELARHGAPGANALVACLRRGDDPQVVSAALTALGDAGDRRYVPVLVEYVQGEGGRRPEAWRTLSAFAPEEAVGLALVHAEESPDAEVRSAALWLLTTVGDARRLESFRRILRGEDRDSIEVVLNTVAEQYLIELAPECIELLRSPEFTVRKAATDAIEKLKFYAEAKRTFEDAAR